ncbi:MAG: Gfo/Idh/MocA family oxidoreductase [Anaerolineales bacterium]
MIKFAITGAGFISKIHAKALQSLPDVELVALVERFTKTALPFKDQFGVKNHYKTINDLLEKVDIDALIVGTPNFLHAPQAIAALTAGVHVMVEKPMAMNAREAYLTLEASQKSGALLMVAHCWRFDPEVMWLKDQVEAGRFGKIIRTKGYGVHENWGPSGWFTQKKWAGGGALADMGVHALDTARFLLGDPLPESVYARIGTYYTKCDVDDTGTLLVNWRGGVQSYIEAGWWQPHSDGPEAATQIYGDKGFGQLFPTYIIDQAGKDDPGFTHPRLEHAPQSLYDQQMRYFIECIHEHRTPTPGAIEGWINMKIVDAAYKSSKTGKVIDIK